MNFSPEVVAGDITLIGALRPAMFSAHWLGSTGLIRPTDLSEENAQEEKVRNEFYQLNTGSFSISVLPERMSITAPAANLPIVRDIVVGLLELRAATAITAMGLNFHAHYKCRDEAEWHKIGDKIIPKSIWRELFPNKNIGLASAQVRIIENSESKNRVDFTVQPSAKIKHGVFCAWNDHHAFAVKDDDPEFGITEALRVIADNYDSLCSSTFEKFEALLRDAVE